MNPLIIGHRELSYTVHPWGVGEIVELLKIEELMFPPCATLDIYELFHSLKKFYYSMGRLNMELAYARQPVLHSLSLPDAQSVLETLRSLQPDRIIVISWEYALGALLAVGAQTVCPLVGKLYAFHECTPVPATLFDDVELVISESLLATQKGHEAGIPLGKMLYLPHCHMNANAPPKKSYLENLAEANGKPLKRTSKTVVIGIACRLRSWKNCLAAFEVVAQLAESGEDILLVLKGDFEGVQIEIAEALKSMIYHPWFLWDQTYTSFPEVLTEYAHFDILLNISGREGANNTTIECLSMGIPCVLLNGTSNPFLFKDAAIMVPIEPELIPEYSVPFCTPQMGPLFETLQTLIRDPALRAEWGRRGKEISRIRFAPELLRKRLPLLFKKTPPFVLEKLYEEDRKLYALD